MISEFFNLEKKEIIPSLGNEIPFNLEKYMMIIFDRFKNENIGDKHEKNNVCRSIKRSHKRGNDSR